MSGATTTQFAGHQPVARVSLVWWAMLLAATPACLVTSDPDFSPPSQTRPEIIANDPYLPSPAVGKLAFYQWNEASEYTAVEFSAWVQSEDAEEPVQNVLLIDYGEWSDYTDGPYAIFQLGPPLAPASLADGPREVAIPWRPQREAEQGCHTVTLVVTHDFKSDYPGYHCPSTADDASFLTWFALVCRNEADAEACLADPASRPCPIEGQGATTYCAGLEQEP